MKSLSGNIVRKGRRGLLYGKARKQYTRTASPASGFKMRSPLKRENTAIIMLTKKGYSINQLSKAFTRSTSYIYKVVRNAITRGTTHFLDKRKLPSTVRLRCSSIRRKTLDRYITGWILFAQGIGDKPP